jgi:hypothetical protein
MGARVPSGTEGPVVPLAPRRADAIVVRRRDLVQIDGENALLVERLKDPLRRALGNRGAFYSVRIETVGHVGEILVSITGSRGRLPLLLGEEELEPGYVFRVVSDTVSRFGL